MVSKKANHVREGETYDFILGYTILNDVSARDVQFRDKEWFRSKSCDTLCPLGPVIADKEEIKDPHALWTEIRVNGDVRQRASTEDMIFKIPWIMEFITEAINPCPGDVVATGTFSGVGVFMDPPSFLENGDHMEAEIE